MDLANEYLRAVAALLPKSQRDDITAELRDTILNRIEEREAELGRKLSDDETEAVLRGIGHPILVAGRYREGPQHVVGPALYPYWLFVVKIAVTLQLAISAVVPLIRLMAGLNISLGAAIGQALTGAVTLVGFATVAAWIIERQGIRIDYLDNWRVRDLRALEFMSWDWGDLRGRFAPGRLQPAQAPPHRDGWRRQGPSISRALGCIIAGAVFALWWTGAIRFDLVGGVGDLRELGMDPGALATVDWSGLQGVLYWPILAYAAALILMGAVMIALPRALALVGLLDIALGAGVLALAGWLWFLSPLAPIIRVDSLTAFVLRLKSFAHGWPMPLEPVVMLVVAATAFGGACRILRGAYEVLVAGLPASARPVPIPASTGLR